MSQRRLRRGTIIVVAAAGLASSLLVSPTRTSAGPTPAYSTSTAGPYGGEPSLVTDSQGNLFMDSPSLGLQMYKGTNNGSTWAPSGTDPDAVSGDTCLATDQSIPTAIYQCNLNGSKDTGPLQADVWKTTDQGANWLYGEDVATRGGTNSNALCGTSCSPLLVDRQWVDATNQTGLTPTQTGALVGLTYHDFGFSHMWINLSDDGGATYSLPEDIVANLNPSTSSAAAIADTACSTVPAALKIAKGGPHPGRIWVAWIAADPTSLLTGCNETQAQAFHNLIVAYADPPFTLPSGTAPTIKWTAQVAYDAGLFHDASSPFAGFTLDNQGNPYFGFVNNLNWDTTCAATISPAPKCEFDMYVVWSGDNGATWTATPSKVNIDTGSTHFFPAITATDPGHVWVSYLETSSVIPTDINGKEHPGSCLKPADGTCTFTGLWYLWGAQATDLLNGDGSVNPTPSWALTQITPNNAPMHQGDICNLGIACVPGISNRNLLDFISEVVDPQGCAHIAFADDKTTNVILSANETAGCVPPTVTAGAPESPISILLLPAAAALAVAAVVLPRRRRKLSSRTS